MGQTRKQKVDAAIDSINAFYRLGRQIPRKAAHKDTYDQGTIEEAARKHGLNPDTARKARQFADPTVGYTPAEVRELCRRIAAVQRGQDNTRAIIGRTHVIRLLSVPRRWRRGIQDAAITNGWSLAELEA